MAWKLSRGEKTVIPQKVNALPLEAGDRLAVRCPGGGGYGNPLERDPARVLEDVHLGFVSAEGAARDYGVVLNSDGTEVNLEATAKKRQERGIR
jgi:N-methylhydantoinase B